MDSAVEVKAAPKARNPRFKVSPEQSMSDEKIHITIAGLCPNHLATFHSYTVIENGNIFECVALYHADANGHVDLTTAACSGGMYTGVEPMGLFWAMKPSPLNKRPHARLLKRNVTTPLVVTIKAYDASIKSLEEIHDMRKKGNLDQLELASVKVNRWFMAPGTKRITLTMKKDGIHGTLFIPPGGGRFPGVISMFGLYPGTMEFKASLLASHGFVCLALAIFGVDGLTDGSYPWYLDFSYFEKAVSVVKNHPNVDGRNGVGVVSLSLSTTISLRMAEFLDGVKCVVCINGLTALVFPGLKYKDMSLEPLDNSYLLFLNASPGCTIKTRTAQTGFVDMVRNEDTDPRHKINFHTKHNVSFMFIAGLSDSECPSEFYANHAEKLLKRAKHPSYQILRYPGAGHAIEPPYGFHYRVSAPKGQVMRDWGGVTSIHCKAQEDSWPKQIHFLKSNLCLDQSKL